MKGSTSGGWHKWRMVQFEGVVRFSRFSVVDSVSRCPPELKLELVSVDSVPPITCVDQVRSYTVDWLPVVHVSCED